MKIRLFRTAIVITSFFTCGILVALLRISPELDYKNTRHNAHITTRKANFTAVIILTQIRSGSSFTGEVLQQHKDAFYVYEPLRTFNRQRQINGSISFLNGTVRNHGAYNSREIFYQTLLGWLTCDFSIILKESLFDMKFLSFGEETHQFTRCIQGNRPLKIVFVDDTFQLCLNKLRTQCLESKYRIIKTIRTPMALMSRLFADLPNVKVIHLVRDPRAQFASLRSLGECENILECVPTLCYDLWEDTKAKSSAIVWYPDKFYTLKYESLVQDPTFHFMSVFKFLDIPFTYEIKMYITKLNDPNSNVTQCEVCKVVWQNKSASAREHVDGWRNVISISKRTFIETMCDQAMDHYNYK